MVILLLLHGLGTLDGAFAGYRSMAGRCALVRRGGVAFRSLVWGACWAQVALGAVELLGLGLVIGGWVGPEALLPAGRAALQVYGAYAGLVAVSYALRAVPSVDVQAATSLALFGPLTLARPVVVVAGASIAVLASPEPVVSVLAAAVVVASLSLGRALLADGGRWHV